MTGMIGVIVEVICTAVLAVFGKGLHWLYQVKTNHLPHIQQAAEQARDAAISIPYAIEKQTTAIVAELREQRSDIRSLTQKL